MTDQNSRIPFYLILVATMVLVGTGTFLFWRAAPDNGASIQASSQADTAIAAARMDPADRKATEAVIRAYILDHPEIIPEAMALLQKREAAKRLTQAGGSIATPFPGAEFGNPKGDVTIVEFTDYNCGYCRSSVADLQKLVDSDKNLRVVIREVPILSESSLDAALWALAAANQGKHKAFHDAMFSGARPDAQSIRAAAAKAGMDLAAAAKFAASPPARKEVEANRAMMQKIGFGGTPTFIIGDQILEGALGYDALKAAVEAARSKG